MAVVRAIAVPTSPYQGPVKSEYLPLRMGKMSALPLVSNSLLYLALIKKSSTTILQY
jgi:hypothetical protein